MSPEERALFIFVESVRMVRTMYVTEARPQFITRQLRNDLDYTYRILDDFLSVCLNRVQQESSEKAQP